MKISLRKANALQLEINAYISKQQVSHILEVNEFETNIEESINKLSCICLDYLSCSILHLYGYSIYRICRILFYADVLLYDAVSGCHRNLDIS